jgi:molecular chaperone GrpE (heat shock protein)
MTKKHDNQAVTQDNDQDLQDLEEMLEEVKSDKDNEEMIEKLQAEIKKLQSQLAEKDEIVKNAQLAYLRTKNDMEMIQRQSAMKAESMHQDLLIKIVKKLLPFVEDLRKSLENLSDEDKKSAM